MRRYSFVLAVLLACCVLLAAGQVTCVATTYYVSPTGSDDNDGLGPGDDHAWANIDRGDELGILVPGDTVIVLAGEYQGADTRSPYPCGYYFNRTYGEPGNPITYQAQGNVVLNAGPPLDDGRERNHVILTYNDSENGNDSRYIVFDGFHMKGGKNSMQINYAVGIEVRNCVFSDYTLAPYAAVYFFQCRGSNKFHHNVIDRRNDWDSMGLSGIGVQVGPYAGDLIECYNNTIVGTEGRAFWLQAGNGIFRNNIIYDCSGVGIEAAALYHSNNMMYNVTTPLSSGLVLEAGETTDVDPAFVDAANGNFQLAAGSPAIDAGAYVGLAFQGKRPDLGAFEVESSEPPDPLSTVTGKVTDAVSGEPLEGARVSIGGTNFTLTDAEGNYTFQLFTQQVSITAWKLGYEEVTKTVDLVEGANTVDFELLTAGPRTYYVSPTGNNGNDGLGPGDDRAWATLDRGDELGVLLPGDTVIVQEGTYVGATARNATCGFYLASTSGAPGNPITYQAQGEVILDAGTRDFVMLTYGNAPSNRSNYIVLDGFHFRGGRCSLRSYYGVGFEVKNCVFSHHRTPNYGAVVFDAWGLNKFHHNLIDRSLGAQWGGLQSMGNASIIEAYNNTFINTGDAAFRLQDGIGEFRNNIIYNCSGTGIIGTAGALTHTHNMMFNVATPYGAGLTPKVGETTDVDPAFVDAMSGDFHLSPGSPAIDAGAYVGLPYQGTRPDLGAFETTSSDPPDPLATVSGKVTNASSGVPIVGATIYGGAGGSTVTDAQGNYTLQTYAGEVTITARLGYLEVTKTVNLAPGVNTVDFQLQLRVFYVSPTGNNANDGLGPGDDHAWASIDRGDELGILGAGDTVIVLPGEYVGATARNANCGFYFSNTAGEPGNPIVYKAQGDVVLRPSGTRPHVILSYNNAPNISRYVVFDGFKFKGGKNSVQLCYAVGYEVKNCVFSDYDGDAYVGVYFFQATGANKFHHNVIDRSTGVAHYGLQADGGASVIDCCNNTIVGTTRAIYMPSGSGVFRNNIIYNCNGVGLATAAAGTAHSHNMMYNVTTPLGSGLVLETGETTDVDPSFVDAVNRDYHLAAGSPAIDAGINVGLPYFGAAPDLGAFEVTQSAVTGKIGEIRNLPDGTLVSVDGVVVTAATGVLKDYVIYVEDPSRASGIRVISSAALPAVTEGQTIAVTGTLTTVDGERAIEASSITSGSQGTSPGTLGVTGKAIIGDGLSNEGMLVKTCGLVTYVGSGYFCVDDGSGRTDGNGHTGIPVVLSDLINSVSAPAEQSYVCVTGLAGMKTLGTSTVAVVRPRSASDIQ